MKKIYPYMRNGGKRMKYTNIGRSGLQVSRLCLGTMNFGEFTDENEAFRIMDAALDAGVNFFDTANHYGGSGENCGRTERIIGNWLSQGGNRRDQIVLATKVYQSMDYPNDGPNGVPGLSAYKIRRHLESSLRRLQTDHIDLYQMHHIDRNVTWEELWGAFQQVVNQGKVSYIGSSNFAGWHLVKAQTEANKRHFLGLISEQHRYNLFCRFPELEVLPAAKDLGIGVLPWSPLAGGMLSGRVLEHNKVRTMHQERMIEKHRGQLEQYSDLCQELGESEANVALSWLLHQPTVTAPVIGPRTLEQFKNTLRAVEINLPEDVLNKLNEIFPGYRPSPEAYAW